MKKLFVIICAAAFMAMVFGGAALGEERLNIVATNFPCYDFARAVAGERAEITLIIKPGAEVHSFEPTPADMAAIMDADLMIYIGGESDVWVDEILASMDDGPEVLRMFDCVAPLEEELLEGMDSESGHAHDEHGKDEYDEHIWTSPKNAVLMVEAVCAALSESDGANAAQYAQAAQAYADKIAQVDARIQQIVDNAQRTELIFGDRFPFLYLARQYCLTCYAAFPGCSSQTEPSAKTLMFLIDRMREDGIDAVYKLEMSTGVIAQTIAEETGAEILTLHSIENVTLDEFEAGETYVSLMQKNADALEKGLN